MGGATKNPGFGPGFLYGVMSRYCGFGAGAGAGCGVAAL